MASNSRILGLLSLLLTTQLVSSRLVIYGPQDLKDKFSTQDYKIQANYANFGNIPYGQSLIGRIYYNASNKDGCERTNFTTDFSGDPDGILTPIFLVDRGNCHFVTKVRNVEKAGGSLAVIIDDSGTMDIKKVIMSDDGTGTGIRIPSMIISKEDGKKLKEFLTKSSSDVARQASLSAEFVFENIENEVKWQFFYTSANDKALDFIRNFRDNVIKLQSSVQFQPRFVSWSCPFCDSDFKRKECFSDGKYCAMNHIGTNVQGKDILEEDLREACLFKLLKQDQQEAKWWDYMQYVHRMCYEEVNEECSKMGHKSIGRDYQITTNCVKDSFEGSKNPQVDDNKILKEDIAAWNLYGSAYWPTVVINDRNYRGDLVPDSVINALCSAFAKEPSQCKKFKEEAGIAVEPEGITGNVLIIVVVLLILVNIVMIFIYRRCSNREMKDDMQLQVNSAVSQYFALSTRNNTSM